MLKSVRGPLGRGLAMAGLGAVLLAMPAFAQEAPPGEYGEGAGVTRARTLPATGGMGDDYLLPAVAGVAGIALGAAGGVTYAMRRRPARGLAR